MTRIAHECVAKFYHFTTTPILRSVKERQATSPNEMERGDVPGWVMITLMTAVIVVLIWGIASTQLTDLLNSAFGKVSKQGG
jgi:hypothetical protein